MWGWIADYREQRVMRRIKRVLELRDGLAAAGVDKTSVAELTQEAEDLAEELLRMRRAR